MQLERIENIVCTLRQRYFSSEAERKRKIKQRKILRANANYWEHQTVLMHDRVHEKAEKQFGSHNQDHNLRLLFWSGDT